MNKDNQGNGMHTVRPHTEDEIYDILKQALDAMRLHTAETHPLVETERAMEAVEAQLAQPAQEPIRREQQLFMDEQAFYAAGHQAMRPAELAERLKRGEKWAVGQERQPQRQPLTDEELYKLRTDAARYRKLVAMEAELVEPITIWHYLRNPDDLDTAHGIKEQP